MLPNLSEYLQLKPGQMSAGFLRWAETQFTAETTAKTPAERRMLSFIHLLMIAMVEHSNQEANDSEQNGETREEVQAECLLMLARAAGYVAMRAGSTVVDLEQTPLADLATLLRSEFSVGAKLYIEEISKGQPNRKQRRARKEAK
jgi:hypothetical protein